MAQKTLTGIVRSTKMQGSVVVEVSRRTPHPLYRKLVTVTKRYIADPNGHELHEGDEVVLVQTRKMAGKKYFTVERSKKR